MAEGLVWGRKKGRRNPNGAQFYESFTLDGVDYSLYDDVLLNNDNHLPNPHVGKIVKIWNQERLDRSRIKILWFFNRDDLPLTLRLDNDDHDHDELFLATGNHHTASGIFNVNRLEALAGKCNVVCTSKDIRNPRPSRHQLQTADFVFYRTFNVETFAISEQIQDQIAGVKAKFLFNKNRKTTAAAQHLTIQPINRSYTTPNVVHSQILSEPTPTKPTSYASGIHDEDKSQYAKPVSNSEGDSPGCVSEFKTDAVADCDMAQRNMLSSKQHISHSENISRPQSTRTGNLKRKILCRPKSKSVPTSSIPNSHRDEPSKKMRLADDTILKPSHDPGKERKKWFADLPWEAQLQNAIEQNRFVMLHNLDPDYSRSEIEDLIYRAFRENCSVRLIEQSTFTNPHHGQALVIFKSSHAAKLVVQKLLTETLMLPNGRPLVAKTKIEKSPHKQSSQLIGIIPVDKHINPKYLRKGKRSVASSSHYSQGNTIEYAMAMEWMYLANCSMHWWQDLHEAHYQEVMVFTGRLKAQ